MPGTHGYIKPPLLVVLGYSSAAVTANLWLAEVVVPFRCRIGAVKVYAQTAGTGAGNTVVDVFLNGSSIWSAAGNRPTLAAASTGEFANTVPDKRAVALAVSGGGAVVGVQVASVSAGGHARLMATVVLEAV